MKPAYLGQYSCCMNISKNNYPEENELDANPSLTLARTLDEVRDLFPWEMLTKIVISYLLNVES